MTLIFTAACSSDSGENGTPAAEGEATKAPASNASATEAPASEAPADKDIHLLLDNSGSSFAASAPEADKQQYIDELSRLSGYHLNYEFLGHDIDYRQQLGLRFASGDLADLVETQSIDWDVHQGAVDQGVFTELGPLLDQYGPNIKKNIPEEAWNSPKVSKNGKIYGIPALTGTPADRIVMIRQDWLDRLGMAVPQTLDDFLKFGEAVKVEDMNGDGDPNNEYALSLTDNMAWNDIFTGSFGVMPDTWHMHDGRLEPDIIQPGMKDAIKFYKQLYDKGYIHKDFITKKQGDRSAEVFNGYLGAWGAATYQSTLFLTKENYINQPDVDISLIAPPAGPDGKRGLGIENDQVGSVWVIPSNVKNAKEIIQFLDWAWSSPDADTFFAYGIEGHNYTTENGEVRFDPSDPINVKEASFAQLNINVRENGLNSPLVVEKLPNHEKILKGYEDSLSIRVSNDAMYMPELKAFDGKPELAPGFVSGSLFYDMFARLVSGKEDVDSGFDKFVESWKSRGGDQAIEEATAWYNSFYNK